ncbi:hypothetical protein HBI83_255930, partial [Parastagonospora nodorum]
MSFDFVVVALARARGVDVDRTPSFDGDRALFIGRIRNGGFTYANPDRRDVTVYQFEKESCIRMLAKTKSLTFYEPVLQIDNPQRAQLEQ